MKTLKITEYKTTSKEFQIESLQEVLSKINADDYNYILKLDVGDVPAQDVHEICKEVANQLKVRDMSDILIIPVGSTVGIENINISKIESEESEYETN